MLLRQCSCHGRQVVDTDTVLTVVSDSDSRIPHGAMASGSSSDQLREDVNHLFPAWASWISQLGPAVESSPTHNQNPDERNAEVQSLVKITKTNITAVDGNALPPPKSSGKGGRRAGAGRKRAGTQMYRSFMDDDIAEIEEARPKRSRLQVKQDQAAHAREARAKTKNMQEGNNVDNSLLVSQTMHVSSLPCHKKAIAESQACQSQLQKLLLSIATRARERSKTTTAQGSEEHSTLHSLLTEKSSVVSQSAAAEKFGEDRSTLRNLQQTAAAALVNSAGFHLGVLQNWMHACASDTGTHNLILFLKKRRYDETPSRIAVTLPESKKQKQQSSNKTGSKEPSATAKILQSEMRLTFVLQCKNTGEYLCLKTAVPTWLQVMERTTAEVTLACQKDIEAVVPEINRMPHLFRHCISLVNTDEYAANFKAERSLALEQPQFHHCHYGCDVHRIARSIKHQLNRVDGHISGMLSGALAMGESGSARSFRECLSQVLEDRLVLRYGNPPDHCMEHTISVLNLFLPMPNSTFASQEKPPTQVALARMKRQRAVLLFFLNGNIGNESQVEHYTPFHHMERNKVLDAMQRFLVAALIPCKPPLFSRKSWTGGDVVMGYFGILTSFHNLLLPTVQLFTQKILHPSNPVSMIEPLPMVQDDESAAAFPTEGLPSDHITAESVATGDVDWSEVSRCMKDRFLTWASLKPRDALVVIRLGTLPCFRLLHVLLERGSKAFERKQRLCKVKTGTRVYQVQEAARGTLIDAFFNHVWSSFQSTPKALPDSSCMLEIQALHFRLLSAGVCCVQQVLGRVWASYPVKLFRALDNGRDFVRDPACMLDPLSLALKEVFESVTPNEFQSLLSSVASEFSTDISQIEAKHASTRRILHTRNVQVKTPTLEDVSAGWVLRNNVISREDIIRPERPEPCVGLHSNKPAAKSESKPKPWKRKQGTWNVFVNQYFSGQGGHGFAGKWSTVEMQECAKAYKKLTVDELQKLQQQAQEAQLRKKFGHTSFSNRTSPGMPSVSDEYQAVTGAIVAMDSSAAASHFQQLERQVEQISSNHLIESRTRAANSKAESEELARFEHPPEVHRSFDQILDILPDCLSTASPFPADLPALDLHLPDAMVEDSPGLHYMSYVQFSGEFFFGSKVKQSRNLRVDRDMWYWFEQGCSHKIHIIRNNVMIVT